MNKMMKLPSNLNNPFRDKTKSMGHDNGFLNPNKNYKQEGKQNY